MTKVQFSIVIGLVIAGFLFVRVAEPAFKAYQARQAEEAAAAAVTACVNKGGMPFGNSCIVF